MSVYFTEPEFNVSKTKLKLFQAKKKKKQILNKWTLVSSKIIVDKI